MQSVEELCIKYVMDELDPSEKLLVEQKMKEDPNMLIEIECLKKTLKRIDNLPKIEPSQEVLDRVMAVARERGKHPIFHLLPVGNMSDNIRYWGAAAVLVLSVSLGSYFLLTLQNGEVAGSTTPAHQSVQAGSHSQNSAVGSIRPWVDNKQILYIEKTNSNNPPSSTSDSAFFESMQKLKPLNSTIQQNRQSSDLQLTHTIEPDN